MAEQTFLDRVRNTIRKNEGQPSTRNAAQWFRTKLRGLRGQLRNQFSGIEPDEFLSRSKTGTTRVVKPGSMYAYFYDPKYKKELPYYDRFPLVLCIEMKPNGFLGANFHYLPPQLRAVLMDKIERSRGMDYRTLSRIREIKPTIKRYLYKHVTSKIAIIEDDEKELALFLPTERFKKQEKQIVYGDSREMIRTGRIRR